MHGATALYLAAQGTHSAAVEALLRSGAAVDAPVDEVHTTPLFAAAERGSALTVRVLLRHGADMRRANWNGLNAAHMAAVRGHVEVLDVLAQYESRARQECAETASPTAGASLSGCRTPPWEMRTHDGSTALILVAAGDEGLGENPSRQLGALRWLLGRGVDVEARRSDGATALVVATKAGHASAVRLLLREAGAAHSAVANDARSPLLIATERGDAAVVRELLEVGAARDAKALDAAVARREPELLALLSAAAYGAHERT
jgi:ankyrin repeat protein